MRDRQTSFEFSADDGADGAPPERSDRRARATPATSQVPLLFRGDHETLEESARRALEVRLATLIGTRVLLSITDNRHTMVSSRRRGTVVELRLHHMFLDADDGAIRALARYLTRSDRRASLALDAYIEANQHRIRKAVPRPARLRTRGRYHDLGDIFDGLNELHFEGAVTGVRVTWSRRAPIGARRRRSIRLGTYVQEDGLIRIHPTLDQEWVPRFFVSYVVFHEMLHHLVEAPLVNGRKHFHTDEFRRRERAYPDYATALAWERANLRRLLRG